MIKILLFLIGFICVYIYFSSVTGALAVSWEEWWTYDGISGMASFCSLWLL